MIILTTIKNGENVGYFKTLAQLIWRQQTVHMWLLWHYRKAETIDFLGTYNKLTFGLKAIEIVYIIINCSGCVVHWKTPIDVFTVAQKAVSANIDEFTFKVK